MPPLADSSLKRAELSRLEAARMISLQSFLELLGSGVRFVLKPAQHFGPHVLERVGSRQSRAGVGVPIQITLQQPAGGGTAAASGRGVQESEVTVGALPALRQLVNNGLVRGTEEIQDLPGRQVFLLWPRALWRHERQELWRIVGAIVGLCVMTQGCQFLGEVQTSTASKVSVWGISLTSNDIGVVLILPGFACFPLSAFVRRRQTASKRDDGVREIEDGEDE